MQLIFESSRVGRKCTLLPACDVPGCSMPEAVNASEHRRMLPEIRRGGSGDGITRRFASSTHGVNDGFYPLGSCTMKYNPQSQRGGRGPSLALPSIHPLTACQYGAGLHGGPAPVRKNTLWRSPVWIG